MYLKEAISALSRLTYTRPAAAALFSIVVLLAAGAAGVRAQSCTAAPAGMVNWYPGNGTTQDIRGGEDATLNSGATYTTGEGRQAFSSNGGTGWISAPAASNLQQITMAGWFRLNSYFGNYPTLFERGNGGNRIGLSIISNDGIISVLNGGSTLGNSAPGAIPLNQWAFVALTVANSAGGNKDVTVYVNGSVVISVTNQTIAAFNNGTFAVMNTNSFKSNSVNGDFDEIQVYNRGLTQSEVQSIYNAGTAGVCPFACTATPAGLAAWLPFDAAAPDATHTFDIKTGQAATVAGTATYQPGKVSSALVFDGSSTYVKENASASLDVGSGPGFTLEAWINPQSTTGSYENIAEWNNGSNAGVFLYVYQSQLYFSVPDVNGTMYSAYFGNIDHNAYSHVAATYDKASGIASVYINGDFRGSFSAPGVRPQTTYDLYLGIRKSTNQYPFQGKMDEVKIFNRALSQSEISAIYYAGNSGNCKPSPVNTIGNLAAWYAGDGDSRDNQGGQGLTFAGHQGVYYDVGKVGQAFGLPGGYLNGYAVTPTLNLGTNWTVELWFNPNGSQSGNVLIGGDHFSSNFGSLFFSGGALYYYQGSGHYWNTAVGAEQPGAWTHVALTYDGSQTRMYINGVLNDVSAAHSETFNNAVRIGQSFNESGGDFKGLIDEPSFYNRALTDSEVQGIYNAGMAGKLKQAATYANAAPNPGVSYGANSTESAPDLPIAPRSRSRRAPLLSSRVTSVGKIPAISLPPVSTMVGDATVTFPTVSSSGMTQEVPIDLSTMPPLPAGIATGLAYDVSTTAAYSGTPTVCFNLPSLAGAFTLLRIYHLENGSWVDRTDLNSSSPSLCTTGLTSLSPFAIARFAPTAADVEISGRIRTALGSGIRDVTVTLSGGGLSQPISARTNSFGYYQLSDVPAGATYIISVHSKRYTFAVPSKVVSLTDSVSAVDFVAESPH